MTLLFHFTRLLFRLLSPVNIELQDGAAFAHLIADCNQDRRYSSRKRRRNFHCRLVALERDERVVGFDLIARTDENFDDRNIFEVADIRHLDVDDGHGRSLPDELP